MTRVPCPAEGGDEAIHTAGLAVNHLDLGTTERIRRAIPVARKAALAVKLRSESTTWKIGQFTGLPVALYQNWLYERNRAWKFTDGTLCVLWCAEFPEARSDYADKHHYVASTRREYNAGRHQADAPSEPSVAYAAPPAPARSVAAPAPLTVQQPAIGPDVGSLSRTHSREGHELTQPGESRPPAVSRPVTASFADAAAPQGFVLASDFTRTAARVAALDEYAAANVLSGKRFVCRSFASCRASHQGDYYEGQLHHVGSHYDLALNGRPFRVVVVGQEYGNGPAHVNRQERSHDVVVLTGQKKRFRTDGLHAARNPHMRGTTSLLRLLFGQRLGSDYDGEILDLNGKRVHLFEAFALVNFLLCSAIDSGQGDVGSKRGKSSTTMQANCGRHFSEVIRILEPTVVVAEGVGVRKWMGALCTTRPSSQSHLEHASIRGHEFLLASFSHPSVPSGENWGTDERRPYLLDVVAPTVRAVHAAVLSAS